MLRKVPEALILRMRRTQFIAFDNDGTLYNGLDLSWNAFKQSWESICKKHNINIEIPSKDAFRSQIGKPASEFFPQLLPEGYKHHSPELHYEISKREVQAITKKQGTLFDGILEMLEILKKRGYKLLLVSNASNEYFQACVENLGYKKFLDGFKCVGNTQKHKGELLRNVMKAFNLTDGVMVGDKVSDINAGKFNDLITIGASYGYGSKEELEFADITISTPLDLLHIL